MCHKPSALRNANLMPIPKHKPGYPNPYPNRPKPMTLPTWGYGGYAEGRY